MKEAVLRMATEDKWTSRKASLQLVSLMLEFGLSNEMDRVIEEVVRSQLEHEEPRVRLQAAETLGRAAQTLRSRSRLWSNFSQPLITLIHDYEERLPVSFADDAKKSSESAVFQPAKGDEVRHATEGWGPLESSLRALLHIIQGYYVNPYEDNTVPTAQPTPQSSNQNQSLNSALQSASTSSSSQSSEYNTLFPITQDLMETLIRITRHQNRFVRETAFLVLSALFEGEEKRIMHQRKQDSNKNADTSKGEAQQSLPAPPLPKVAFMDYLQRMAHSIRDGMMDDWSHVVLGASGACRSLLFFLRTLAYSSPASSIYDGMEALLHARRAGVEASNVSEDVRFFFDAFEVLLPPLCLNRYTSAEGLRNYTLGTWKRVVLSDGPRLVSLFLNENVLPFYFESLQSHNAATRETASYCLGELVQKIPNARGDDDGSDDDDDDDDDKKPSNGSNGPLDDEDINKKLPKVPRDIEESLRRMTHDASWPVRDASLSSLSLLILNINANSLDDIDLSTLTSVIEERLNDPLASVRQTAATALISFLERMIDDDLSQVAPSAPSDSSQTPDEMPKKSSSKTRPKSLAQRLKVKEGGKDSGDGDDSDSDSDSDDDEGLSATPNDQPSNIPQTPSGSKIAKFVNYIIETIQTKLTLFLESGVVEEPKSDAHSHSRAHDSQHGHHHHNHGHDSKKGVPDSQVSKHVQETGEELYGPLSKLRHDNDPELHKEQEIFGCECHSTPHTCKAHSLTSKKRETWETSQSALFLLSSLVHALATIDNPSERSSDPSKKSRPSVAQRKTAFIAPFLPKLLTVVSLAVKILGGTKRLFDKYGTWQTTLTETLEKILKDISGLPPRLFPVPQLRYILPSGESESKADSSASPSIQTWKSVVSVLFRIIASEEKIGTTAVSRGTMPLPSGPVNPMQMRGMAPGGPGFAGPNPASFIPSSSAGPGHPLGNFPGGPVSGASPFALNPTTMHAAAPSYAASIKPSVARASSSMLLIDACASLLVLLHTTFGSSFVLDGTQSEEKSIFRRKCGPLLAGPQRGFPF